VRVGRSVVAAASSAAGLVLAAAFLGITVQANALAREKAMLQSEISAALADNARLQQQISRQGTDDYVTELARKLGWIGPNESLFAVQRDGQASGSAAKAPAAPSRLAKWITFFFGRR
jgi:type II secretory pathway component PulJ